MFQGWDYQSDQKGSSYEFLKGDFELNHASVNWINMGQMYTPSVSFKLSECTIISNFLDEIGAKREGLLGYFGRIESNLKMLNEPEKISNVLEIGPGWGGLRAYCETLDINYYTCIEPISETKKILEYNFDILENLGSKIETKIFSDHHKAICNLKKNPRPTLFYAANVLSEVSEDYLSQYISFLEDAMQQNDLLIIEDWFRKERKTQLLNLTCSKFTLVEFKVNTKNSHITAVFKNTKSSLKSRFLSKFRFKLYLNLIFPLLNLGRILLRNSFKTLLMKIFKKIIKK